MSFVGILALAALDSVNPSAIVVTLYLLSRPRAHAQVAVYIGAIFATYLALGVLLVLGVDVLLPSLGDVLRTRSGLLAQSLVGLVLLAYSLTSSTDPGSSQVAPPPSTSTYAAVAMLGVTVTAMELPTAMPYFAAIALIAEASLPVHRWAPLLGLYNLIFVLPPIALLAGHLVLGKRLTDRYEALRQRLQRGAQETALWIAGLVGGGLLVSGIVELAARLR